MLEFSMKYILSILSVLLCLLVTPFAHAVEGQKEGANPNIVEVIHVTCDNGTTIIEQTEYQKGMMLKITTALGNEYEQGNVLGIDMFPTFKAKGSAQEETLANTTEWWAKLLHESPNFYNWATNKENDCAVVPTPDGTAK